MLRAYLLLGFATLLACALMAAHTVIIAPTTGYAVLIQTNQYGEGAFEAILILCMFPAWLIILRRGYALIQ